MKRHEFGTFYAIPFNGNCIKFVVFDDYTIDCPTLGVSSFKRMELKPRFVMWNEENYYRYNVPASFHYRNSQLIGNYQIEEELFAYLKQNQMIIYSTDMAYLYGFPDTDGYDKDGYSVGSPYKWAKKKGPILVKQKRGQFN